MAAAAAPLYSPDLLALAVSLAEYPLDETLPLQGTARSRTCGGHVSLACSTDHSGVIERVGLRASACAVGQAAAALFVASAAGQTRSEIAATRHALGEWLAGGPQPDWPGIARIEAALPYPARHGAIVLAWDAALAALPKP